MLPWFAPLAAAPVMIDARRDARWWLSFVVGTALPAVTLLPFFQLGEAFAPATRLFPQMLTNQIAIWAVLNSLVMLGLSFIPGGARPKFSTHAWRSAAIAVLTVDAPQ